MRESEIKENFQQTMKGNPDISHAIAAIRTLIEFIGQDNSETLQGLRKAIRNAIDLLTQTDCGLVTSIKSGCELFWRFITFTQLDERDFTECKKHLVERGNMFLEKVQDSRNKIAKLGHPFVPDGAVVLTHSRSRVVLSVLREAMQTKKRFTVYVTESMPDRSGHRMQEDLEKMGIPAIVILDSAVGYIMESVDMVLVGAEGVVESGGIINKIGTFSLAIVAKEMKKPFYVVAESFKFTRLFPLNQRDIPNEFKFQSSKLKSDLEREHPMVDYTPPYFISLLFTDLGVLTPSAVSDELIKIYM